MAAFRFSIFSGLLLLTIASSAQLKKPGITLGASAYYASPMGNFASYYKGGVGGEVKGGIGMGQTYLVATIGYGAFLSKSEVHNGTLTYKPLKIGVKHYFLAKRIFVNGDIGTASLKDKTMSTAENLFSYDYGAGVRLLGLEAGIYHNNWKNINSSGMAKTMEFKLGYNITL